MRNTIHSASACAWANFLFWVISLLLSAPPLSWQLLWVSAKKCLCLWPLALCVVPLWHHAAIPCSLTVVSIRFTWRWGWEIQMVTRGHYRPLQNKILEWCSGRALQRLLVCIQQMITQRLLWREILEATLWITQLDWGTIMSKQVILCLFCVV